MDDRESIRLGAIIQRLERRAHHQKLKIKNLRATIQRERAEHKKSLRYVRKDCRRVMVQTGSSMVRVGDRPKVEVGPVVAVLVPGVCVVEIE